MMTTRAQQFDVLLSGIQNGGSPVSTGYVKFFVPGTTTPKNAYDDREKAAAITKKALDVNGRAEVWGDGIYRLKFYSGDPDAGGVEMSSLEIAAYKVTATEGQTRTIAVDTTGSIDDSVVKIDTTSANVTYTLPSAVLAVGRMILIQKAVAVNTMIVAAPGGQAVNGAASVSYTSQYATGVFISDGSNWAAARETLASLGVSALGVSLLAETTPYGMMDVLSYPQRSILDYMTSGEKDDYINGSGNVDHLAAVNLAIADINDGTSRGYISPPGVLNLSANPNAITADKWAVWGYGPGATQWQFLSTAGTNGKFFTLGNASTKAGQWLVHGLYLEALNKASLDGTENPFLFLNCIDGTVENVKCQNTAGVATFGDNTANLMASRIFMDKIRASIYGPAEGTIYDGQWGNGMRMHKHTIVIGDASVTGGVLGIHIHPVGTDPADGTRKTCDAWKWNFAEFNFPDDSVNHILKMDATEGIIVNQWFDGIVFDHSLIDSIWLLIGTGAAAGARMDNLVFTDCRCTPDVESGSDAISVLIAAGNNDRRLEAQFKGGFYHANANPAFSITGTNALKKIYIGGGLTIVDKEGTTPKLAIQGNSGLTVDDVVLTHTSNLAAGAFTHGVGFTGTASNFTITDAADFSEATVGDVDTTNLAATNAHLRRIGDNIRARQNLPQQVLSTTDATPTVIAQWFLEESSVYNFYVSISAVKDDGSARDSSLIFATFYRDGAAGAVISGAATTIRAMGGPWAAAIAASANNVQVTVTGAVGTNINWGCNIRAEAIGE